ncbi:MAG TPA: CRTAC1 family protein [Planctomycetota bacterium]|nr:CRTAC1 family protein [Planctomycetota bacterium]
MRRVAALLLLALAACPGRAASPEIVLRDATAEVGLGFVARCGGPEKRDIVEANGVGVAVLDADRDGDLDLFFAQGTTLAEHVAGRGARPSLWLQDAGRFAETDAAAAGLAVEGWWTTPSAADADGDGDTDVLLCGYGRTAYFRNESAPGAVRFVEATQESGLVDSGWSTEAAWFDADNDGDLDVYLVRYLELDPRSPPRGVVGPLRIPCTWRGLDVYCGPKGFVATPDRFFRNRGDGTFEEATAEAGFAAAPASYGLGACPVDFDRDGDTDLYVANDSKANFLWRNDGGHFVECALAAGAAVGDDGSTYAGMGVAADDLDGDGLPDVVVTNFSDEPVSVYRNRGGGTFVTATWTSGVGAFTQATLKWGVDLADFDLDGDLDVFVANGHVYPQADSPNTGTSYRQANQLFVNDGHASFRLLDAPEGSPLRERRAHRAVALLDLDDDGDDDLVIVPCDGPAIVLRNEAPVPSAGGRARVRVELRGSGKNTDALGAVVTVRAGGRAMAREVRRGGSYAASRDPRLCFGLGDARDIESIEVRWPGGARETIPGAGLVNRAVTIAQGRGVVARAELRGSGEGRP